MTPISRTVCASTVVAEYVLNLELFASQLHVKFIRCSLQRFVRPCRLDLCDKIAQRRFRDIRASIPFDHLVLPWNHILSAIARKHSG